MDTIYRTTKKDVEDAIHDAASAYFHAVDEATDMGEAKAFIRECIENHQKNDLARLVGEIRRIEQYWRAV